MKRYRKLAARIARWLCIALGLALAAQTLLLPGVVQRLGLVFMRKAGLPAPSLNVRYVSPLSLSASDIAVADHVKVASVSARYSPATLVRGRVRALAVSAAVVKLRVRDGAVDLSWLPRGGDGGSPKLPFDRLALKSCRVEVDLDGHTIHLPFSGLVLNEGNGRCRVECTAQVAGLPVEARGTVDLRTNAPDLVIAGSAAIGGLLAAVPPELTRAIPLTRGRLHLTGVLREEGLHLKVSLKGGELAAVLGQRQARAAGVEATLEASFDRGLKPTRADLTGRIAEAAYDRTTAADVAFEVSQRGERIEYGLRAEGSGWQLKGLTGLASLPSSGTTTLTAQFEAEAELPPLEPVRIHDAAKVQVAGRVMARLSSGTWQASVEECHVSLPPVDVSIDVPGIACTGLAGRLALRAELGPERMTTSLAGPSWVAFEEARLPVGDDVLRVPKTKLAIEAMEATWPERRLSAVVKSVTELSAATGSVSAHIGHASCRVTASLSRPDKPGVHAVLRLDRAQCQAGAARLAGISAEVPFWLNLPAGPSGTVEIREVHLAERRLPGISASVRLSGPKVEFQTAWRPLEEVEISANGWLAGGRGEVEANLPRLPLSSLSALDGLLPVPDGLSAEGTVSAHAHLRITPDGLKPLVHVRARDVAIESQAYEASMTGMDADLTIDCLWPISTLGRQRIKVASARMGKLEVRDGFVDFRIDGPNDIFIEQTKWGWAGGWLSTHALRVNPMAPKYDLTVFGEGLDLKQLLDLIPGKRATGDGSLYGRLSVSIHWPRIHFGSGFLYAAPGRGTVQLADAEILGSLLARDPRFSADPVRVELRNKIVDALRDFEYTVFKVDFAPEREPSLARVHLEGKGRQGVAAVPIAGLDINFKGVDEALNAAIIVKRTRDRLLDKTRLRGERR